MSHTSIHRSTRIPARVRRQLAAAGLALLVPHLAQAAVLVSNIDEPRRAASTIQQDPDLTVTPPVDYPWAAQSFSTDANAYVLQSIDVVLGGRVDAPMVVAELRADDGTNAPGAFIAALDLSSITTGAPSDTALSPNSTVNLAPGTLYWLVMGAAGSGSYAFEYAEGNAMTGPGALGSYAYSNDRGASWTNFGSDNPYKLRVNVARTDVDAPGMQASMALGVLGMLSLGLVRRRRSRS